jgi:hypothetical protein
MNALMTAAPVITSIPERIPTGNLEIALPAISRLDAGVYSLGVLSMQANGQIEIAGSESDRLPLAAPWITQNGSPLELTGLDWVRLSGWVPRFTARCGALDVTGTIFAPPGEKGFVYLLEVRAREAARSLQIGLQGSWAGVDYLAFKKRPIACALRLEVDPWTHSLVGEACLGLPLIAWGLQASGGGEPELEGCRYRWVQSADLEAGESLTLAYYFSVNLEGDGARTGALHLRRRGWQALFADTLAWLNNHTQHLADPELERALNENLFFNYFYAQGKCIDSGELALLTSRSDSYYVCAAYWARDALLWSFPGLLQVDRQQARCALTAAWSRYLPNAPQHALYINGQNLYPGFELDQAAAPLVAMGHYLDVTGDWKLVGQLAAPAVLQNLQAGLQAHYSAHTGLYATFLTPHDDPTAFSYLTCNNVLVWGALGVLAELYEHADYAAEAEVMRERAVELKDAILNQCVVGGPFGPQFAGGVDDDGLYELVDLPGASWSCFTYYGFCKPSDPIYQNSLRWITSTHNPYYYTGKYSGEGAAHFPYPSSFDLANRLLRKDPDAIAAMRSIPLDHGLCCESFDPGSGVVKTGAAFATMAGWLGYCLLRSQTPERDG